MNKRFTFLIILFISGIFQACIVPVFASHALKSDGQKNQIMDSIKLLDSLSFLSRISNNPLSIKYAKREIQYSKTIGNPGNICTAYSALGNAFLTSRKDSSLYYYNLAVQVANNYNLSTARPQLLYNLAMVSLDASDYKNAIILIDSCIRLSKKYSQNPLLSDAYNSLGLIQIELNDSITARSSFSKALEIARQYSLPIQIGRSLGNLAMFEKDVRTSISIQIKAVNFLNQRPGTDEEKATILINIGNAQSNPDSAIFYYGKALALSVKGNLPLVEIAAYNSLANRYLQKGNAVKADEYIMAWALPLAQKQNNLDWISTLYDTYADIKAKTGNYQGAFNYERMSMDSKAQFDAIKAADHMRLLSSLLDLKNKELIIKNEETEIEVKTNQNTTLKLELIVSGLLILFIVLLFLWFHQKSKIKIKQQQISSARRLIELEEAEKGRIGFELHDTIGYLVRIIESSVNSTEFTDVNTKESLMRQLTEMGETIRRISHRMNLIRQENSTFQELFSDIINDMKHLAGLNIKYFFPEYIPALSREIILHFCRITEELLTNSSKYARESAITIQLACVENRLFLFYSDDGTGFDLNTKSNNGIGINSILARAALLNGQAILKTEPGKGTSWEISVPLS